MVPNVRALTSHAECSGALVALTSPTSPDRRPSAMERLQPKSATVSAEL